MISKFRVSKFQLRGPPGRVFKSGDTRRPLQSLMKSSTPVSAKVAISEGSLCRCLRNTSKSWQKLSSR